MLKCATGLCNVIATSLEEHIAEVGAMYRYVTHGAGLILLRLVVLRTYRPLCGKRMALQAQQVDLADPQQTRARRTMREMTTAAAFRFYRDMFIDKRALLVSVALVANKISARKSSHLPQSCSAVNIVAVAAADQSLLDAVVVWLREICLGRGMAAIAKLRLFLHQQMLRLFGVMWRMAVETSNVIAVMGRLREAPLFVRFAVAAQAAFGGVLPRQALKTDDLADIAAALHMRRTGPVAGLTAMTVFQGGLEVWRALELFLVHILVAGFAGVRSHILRAVFGLCA